MTVLESFARRKLAFVCCRVNKPGAENVWTILPSFLSLPLRWRFGLSLGFPSHLLYRQHHLDTLQQNLPSLTHRHLQNTAWAEGTLTLRTAVLDPASQELIHQLEAKMSDFHLRALYGNEFVIVDAPVWLLPPFGGQTEGQQLQCPSCNHFCSRVEARRSCITHLQRAFSW